MFCSCLMVFTQNTNLLPSNLRLNYSNTPLGVDDKSPRFSWELNSDIPNQKQSAYEIIVALSKQNIDANIGEVWTSGKISNNQQNGIVYKGVPLIGQTQYWWKVRTYDKDDVKGKWSDAATFETGILNTSDWKASYLTGSYNLMRKDFSLTAGKTVAKARAYVASNGWFELSINGSKIGDHVLDPNTTDFSRLLLYSTFDITSQLKATNGIGLMIGGFNKNHSSKNIQAICQIDIWYTDGTTQTVVSDGTWKALWGGPIKSQHIFNGENYDARNELPGWNNFGYNATYWATPVISSVSLYPAGWSVSNGFLTIIGGNLGIINVGSTLTDYSIEEDVVITNTCAGIVFRAKDEKNAYYWQFSAASLRLTPYIVTNGVYTKINNGVIPSTPLVLNKKLHIKIDIKGNNIKTYIDNELVHEITDNTYTTGTIGFRQSGAESANFDNIVVKANNVVVFSDDFSSTTSSWMKSPISLKSQLCSIKIIDEITPVSISNPATGTYVYNVGENVSGWAQLTAQGAAGTRIILRFAERIYPDGTLNRTSNKAGNVTALACDTFTFKGNGVEVWEPRFTYHGFRYVEITGFPGTPTLNSIKIKSIHSDVTGTVSTFNCSNPDLNKIYEAYKRGQLDNMMSIPTDCNQRAERTGWLSDAMVTSESAMLYFDAFSFYEKFFYDLIIGGGASGAVGGVAPFSADNGEIIWGSAVVSMPWDHYKLTGDTAQLSKTYYRSKKFVDWVKGLDTNNDFMIETLNNKFNGVAVFRWNDWCPVGGNAANLKPTNDYMASIYYYNCANLIANMSEVLGKATDLTTYRTLATNIKNVLNARYLINGTYYDNNKQTANAVALGYNVVPDVSKSNVLNAFFTDINHSGDAQLKTGCLGTYSLMNVLGDNGKNDLAYKLASRTTYPSWGYMLNVPNASGTFWETWHDSDNSKNHVFLAGSVAAWLFNYVAGIKSVQPGFSEIQLKPDVTTMLSNASATLYTVKGAIKSSWLKTTNNDLLWDVTIPANCTAKIYFPTWGKLNAIQLIAGSTVVWNGTSKNLIEGLSYLKTEGDFHVWICGSGKYSFKVSKQVADNATLPTVTFTSPSKDSTLNQPNNRFIRKIR